MLTIVLVAPQMGENIGAVARAMGNFGLSDLRIVNPRDGWPNEAAIAMAAHAKPIIENAQIFDSLEEAIADCYYVAAATARQRDMQKPHTTPREWANSPCSSKTALLLGRENNGLSNEEITLAHSIVTVPVHEDCPSINLAQSAAILCYEWFQADIESKSHELEPPAEQSELHSFFNKLEKELDEADYWQVDEKKEKMWRNLRNYFIRGNPTTQEVRSLHGVLKALGK